jgi:Tfp pilus assembly protein FimT
MGVVIIVLAMFACLVVPNMLANSEGQKERLVKPRLEALVSLGRSMAASRRETVTLTYDSQDKAFVLSTGSTTDNEGTQASKAALPDSVTIARMTLKGDEVGESDFSVQFRPDGTADEAGVEFDAKRGTFSWFIGENRSDDAVSDSELSEKPETKWEAGEIEHRF